MDEVFRGIELRFEALEQRVAELEKKFGGPNKKTVRKRVNLLYSQFSNDLAKSRDHAKLQGDMEAVRLIQTDMDRIENS